MNIARTVEDIRSLLFKSPGPVGLVPTMGFLHEGHMSLFNQARKDSKTVVGTIFVNPTQFGPSEDLESYPVNIERDIKLLEAAGVDILFIPTRDVMYPDGFDTWVEVGELTTRLEGHIRPGHFRGVSTVVAKLFNIVRPSKAYFGQKDAQQLLVLKELNKDLNFGIDIVSMPIVREHDGLAMSSRNSYLTSDQRIAASVLYRSLKTASRIYLTGEKSAGSIRKEIENVLNEEPLASIEYISLADTKSLCELEFVEVECLVSIAVKIGTTRLIDNIVLHPKELR